MARACEWNADNTLARMANRVAFDDSHTISVHEYDYDALGRRQTAVDKAGSLTLPAQNDAYAYDALDNRTRKTVNGVDQYAIFDAANQLVELRNGSPTGALAFAFVYDANGNLTMKCEGTGVSRTTTTCSGSTVSSFTWNPDDQLVAFYKPGVSESYQYDQAGRRIAKTSNGVTTYYRYNGDDIDAEYSATWSETARYVHGPNTDDPLMRLTGNTSDPSATAIYYHQDGIGSVVATSDQAGNIVAAQVFDAWGNRVQSSGTIQTYGYTGREPDQTGLIYYRARYYDPALGRFISRDPAGMPDGVNRYAYVNNNPINLTDPTGLYAKQYNTNTNTANISYMTDASSLGGIFGSGNYSLAQTNRPTFDENPFGSGAGSSAVMGAATISSSATMFPAQSSAWASMDVGNPFALNNNGAVQVAMNLRCDGVNCTGGGGGGPGNIVGGSGRGLGVGSSGGRLGNQATRLHVNQVATEMESRGWTVTRGGGRGPEEYLPGPGGARRGSSYPDITATKNGKTLRVNTVDTYADRVTPTTREATNAARIRTQTGEHLLLIPKP